MIRVYYIQGHNLIFGMFVDLYCKLYVVKFV